MEKITTIGLDIAKSVFQVHGVDAAGEVVVRKRLSRARVIPFFAKLPRCLIGIEACNISHHLGPRVDCAGPRRSADAGAVCEAEREARQE